MTSRAHHFTLAIGLVIGLTGCPQMQTGAWFEFSGTESPVSAQPPGCKRTFCGSSM